jgi:hypothetical protein
MESHNKIEESINKLGRTGSTNQPHMKSSICNAIGGASTCRRGKKLRVCLFRELISLENELNVKNEKKILCSCVMEKKNVK